MLTEKTYALLALAELTILVCLAAAFGVIAFHMEKSLDQVLSRPPGVSREEFDRTIVQRDREIARLQRLTHTMLMEEDQD